MDCFSVFACVQVFRGSALSRSSKDVGGEDFAFRARSCERAHIDAAFLREAPRLGGNSNACGATTEVTDWTQAYGLHGRTLSVASVRVRVFGGRAVVSPRDCFTDRK